MKMADPQESKCSKQWEQAVYDPPPEERTEAFVKSFQYIILLYAAFILFYSFTHYLSLSSISTGPFACIHEVSGINSI
jgi:hypothetical protein